MVGKRGIANIGSTNLEMDSFLLVSVGNGIEFVSALASLGITASCILYSGSSIFVIPDL